MIMGTPASMAKGQKLLQDYISCLQDNIDNCFKDSIPVLTAMQIFNPQMLLSKDSSEFEEYGKNMSTPWQNYILKVTKATKNNSLQNGPISSMTCKSGIYLHQCEWKLFSSRIAHSPLLQEEGHLQLRASRKVPV